VADARWRGQVLEARASKERSDRCWPHLTFARAGEFWTSDMGPRADGGSEVGRRRAIAGVRGQALAYNCYGRQGHVGTPSRSAMKLARSKERRRVVPGTERFLVVFVGTDGRLRNFASSDCGQARQAACQTAALTLEGKAASSCVAPAMHPQDCHACSTSRASQRGSRLVGGHACAIALASDYARRSSEFGEATHRASCTSETLAEIDA